jgi:hypothetical protein
MHLFFFFEEPSLTTCISCSFKGVWTVNGGDYLSLAAGRERAVSPVHRVICCDSGLPSRMSAVFFWYPRYGSEVPGVGAKVKDGRGLSLFADQREGSGDSFSEGVEGEKDGENEGLRKSFGDYISDKWASVQRKPK